jgi:signal transduction histidine kinase/ligand-binding sensor domain-containing protein
LALFTFSAAIMAVASLRQAGYIDSPAALTRLVDVILGCAGLLPRTLRPAVVWTCAWLATIGVPIARALDLQQYIGQLYQTGWTAKNVFASILCGRIRLILLLPLISLVHPGMLAQAGGFGGQRVIEESWTFRDGAPEQINSLAQTGDGFLWLGGSTGLFRFDGKRFERFQPSSGDQLLSTDVYAVFAPPTGGLWVGYTFGGFSFLNNGRVKNYSGESAASTGTIWQFAQDHDGVVWAGTTSGLWRFQDSVWRHLGAEWNAPNGSVGYVAFDRTGTLWVKAGKKLLYLRPGSKQFRVADENLRAEGFTLDVEGRVVTSQRSQQAPNSRGNSEERPQDFPILRNHSTQIMDRNNSVWIIDTPPHSLARIQTLEQLKNVLSKNTRNSETYNVHPYGNAQLVDREGNIWFSDGRDTYRFFYSPLMEQKGPFKLGPFAVAADDDGAVWIGSWRSPELYHVARGKIDAHYNVRQAGGLETGWSCAYRAPDKTFWFGGRAGLWHLVHRKLMPIKVPHELIDQVGFLQAIAADRLGGLWFSFGRHGLYRLADGVWTPYGGRNDLPKTGVITEFTDGRGRVWFGYRQSQLAVLDGDRVRVYGPSDGVRVGNITAIYGRGPEIWIGGEFGLQQFSNGRFHTIAAVDGNWIRGIAGIVEMANGDLWLNGLSGIVHIGRAEVAAAIKSSTYQVKAEHLGAREGLQGVAEQLRPLGSAIEGSDGRLWFAEMSGLVWLDPNRSAVKVLPLPPPITIQTVAADDKNYETVSSLTLPAHTSSVQINYAAVSLSEPEAIRFRYKLQEISGLSLIIPERVKFRYRLEGLKQDWVDAGIRRQAFFTNLAPGRYAFEVLAYNNDGVWTSTPAVWRFVILPAYYQTLWFKAALWTTAVMLLWLFYLYRLRQISAEIHSRFHERQRERERIARELHDTLLQGFQGLVLRFQAILNRIPEDDPLRASVRNALLRADEVLIEGRDRVHEIRSEPSRDLHMLLGSFGDSQASESTSFQLFLVGTVVALKPLICAEVYCIAREALANAFRHASASQVEAELIYDRAQFNLRIRDNGTGIDKQTASGGRLGHWGLQGMRERANLTGGKLSIWSRPGAGTEVELLIPGKLAYAESGRSDKVSWWKRVIWRRR